jgi:hypothetical protein
MAEAEKSEKKTFEVLGAVKHDGKDYRKGDSIKISASQAAHLARHGVVKLPPAAKK